MRRGTAIVGKSCFVRPRAAHLSARKILRSDGEADIENRIATIRAKHCGEGHDLTQKHKRSQMSGIGGSPVLTRRIRDIPGAGPIFVKLTRQRVNVRIWPTRRVIDRHKAGWQEPSAREASTPAASARKRGRHQLGMPGRHQRDPQSIYGGG